MVKEILRLAVAMRKPNDHTKHVSLARGLVAPPERVMGEVDVHA